MLSDTIFKRMSAVVASLAIILSFLSAVAVARAEPAPPIAAPMAVGRS
jgi:hypothetical protein